MKNLWVCVIVFLISAAALGWAYYSVGWNAENLSLRKFGVAILIGCVATFFIFWSVAGMLLRVMMSAKGIYHHGLNSFTFRQLSSKVNTTVASMTVICLMLFVTICTLSTAFTIRNSMNQGVEENYPVDFYVQFAESADDPEKPWFYKGGNIDDDFTFYDYLGDKRDEFLENNNEIYSRFNFTETIIKLSDYNALMKLYGKEQIELADDEYAVCANALGFTDIYTGFLKDKPEAVIYGKSLKPKFTKCIETSIYPGMQANNAGAFIVPDNAVSENGQCFDNFVGNYKATDKKEIEAAEKTARAKWENAIHWYTSDTKGGTNYNMSTRIETVNSAIGIGAIVTFLGLYIGFIFLVSCGAILALKELSESADSLPRYTMLRKLGVEEKEITKSIFRQSGIFFLLPLLLACLHAYVGMRFGRFGLELLITGDYIKPVLFTAALVVLIYGGYFLLTFLGSKAVTREQK